MPLTHKYCWKQPELPAEENTLENSPVPGMFFGFPQSDHRVLFLFFGEIPGTTMRWKTWNEDPTYKMSAKSQSRSDLLTEKCGWYCDH
jgi:hypothetical protein